MKEFCPPKFYQKVLYWIGTRSFRIVFKLFWRLEISGVENVPMEGSVLLASNHMSLADPPLIGACAPRPLYFFAKEELFRVFFLGWLIRQVNAFPVKRYEHDVGAFKRAYHLLKSGQPVLLFPEGRRSKTGQMGKAKGGVGMLASKTGSPVVPVCIINTNRLFRFKKLKVIFGTPMTLHPSADGQADYVSFSNAVTGAIADLGSKMYN